MAEDKEHYSSDIPERPDGASRPTGSTRLRKGVEEAPRGGLPMIWIVLFGLLLLFIIWQYQTSPQNYGSNVEYSFFLKQLDKNNVAEARIDGQILMGKWKQVPENPQKAADPKAPALDQKFNTVMYSREDRTLLNDLMKKEVDLSEKNQSVSLLTELLIYSTPVILMLVIFLYFMRRTADPFSSGMFGSFIRSPAKRFRASDQRNTFDDVAVNSSKRAR